MDKKKGLGRGLESLFGFYEDESNNIITNQTEKKVGAEGVTELDINRIYPNPNQPRKHFDEEALRELASSIKTHGVIQPLVVNKESDGYMIIAGERRWRASKQAGLEKVPVVVKNYTEKQVKEISIIENLQREDLNPIEAARAIKQLMDEYNLTQEVVSDRIGKSRSNVANTLRLLSLYPDVIKMVEDGKLSSGHARSLVVIDDVNEQLRLAKKAVDGKLSVRDLEKRLKHILIQTEKRKLKLTSNLLNLKNS